MPGKEIEEVKIPIEAKKERAPWGARQLEILKAYATPDPQDPNSKLYPLDEDVVRAVYAEELKELIGTELTTRITGYKDTVQNAKRRFLKNLLHSTPDTSSNIIRNTKTIFQAIQSMYPNRTIFPQDVEAILDRPKLRKPVSGVNNSKPGPKSNSYNSQHIADLKPVIPARLENSHMEPIDIFSFLENVRRVNDSMGESEYMGSSNPQAPSAPKDYGPLPNWGTPIARDVKR